MLILVDLVIKLAEYNVERELTLHIFKLSLELVPLFLDAMLGKAEDIKSLSFCEILRVLDSDGGIAKIELLHLT